MGARATGRASELRAGGRRARAAEADGELENDYLETAVVADLPFPPRARPSCATAPATAAVRRVKRLRLSVFPRRVRAGRRTRLRFYVRTWAGRRATPVRRATIRVAGRRVRTDRRGRARVTLRPRRAGPIAVRVTRGGMRSARRTLRVR